MSSNYQGFVQVNYKETPQLFVTSNHIFIDAVY